MANLHEADAIPISRHAQGSTVSTHLPDRRIRDGNIVTAQNSGFPKGTGVEAFPSAIVLVDMNMDQGGRRKVRRVCYLVYMEYIWAR